MHKLESVQENGIHKLLWNFEIQIDHPIAATRTEIVLINKKKRTCYLVDLDVAADYRMKMKERQISDLPRELKKL